MARGQRYQKIGDSLLSPHAFARLPLGSRFLPLRGNGKDCYAGFLALAPIWAARMRTESSNYGNACYAGEEPNRNSVQEQMHCLRWEDTNNSPYCDKIWNHHQWWAPGITHYRDECPNLEHFNVKLISKQPRQSKFFFLAKYWKFWIRSSATWPFLADCFNRQKYKQKKQ